MENNASRSNFISAAREEVYTGDEENTPKNQKSCPGIIMACLMSCLSIFHRKSKEEQQLLEKMSESCVKIVPSAEL